MGGRPGADPFGAGGPFAGFAAPAAPGPVRAASASSSAGRSRASSPTSSGRSSPAGWRVPPPGPRRPARPRRSAGRAVTGGRGPRPAAAEAPASTTSSPAWAGSTRRSGRACRRRRGPTCSARAAGRGGGRDRLSICAEAFAGTKRLVEVDGQAPRGEDPGRRGDRQPDPAPRPGRRGGPRGPRPGAGGFRPPPPRLHARGREPHPRAAGDPARGAPGRRGPGRDPRRRRLLLKIPAGPSPAARSASRARACPACGATGRGDLLVRVRVVLPSPRRARAGGRGDPSSTPSTSPTRAQAPEPRPDGRPTTRQRPDNPTSHPTRSTRRP